jgi:hypothetical protein
MGLLIEGKYGTPKLKLPAPLDSPALGELIEVLSTS